MVHMPSTGHHVHMPSHMSGQEVFAHWTPRVNKLYTWLQTAATHLFLALISIAQQQSGSDAGLELQ